MIGLAVLEARLAAPGTRLEVDGAGAATVEPLPIYDPEKGRPRG